MLFLLYFHMINYFQAIQTARLYKKNMFEMFRPNLNIFLDLQRSCDQDKNQSKEKLAIEMWSQNFFGIAFFSV